jgi:hypothetical protein
VRILATLVVATAALAAAVAPASAKLSGAFMVGYANNTRADTTGGGPGIRATVLREIDPVASYGVELGFYRLDAVTTPSGDERRQDAVQTTLQIRTRGVTFTARPFFTAGLGAYWHREAPELERWSTSFGYNLGGGYQFGLGPWAFALDARWHWVTGSGNPRIFAIMAGVHHH